MCAEMWGRPVRPCPLWLGHCVQVGAQDLLPREAGGTPTSPGREGQPLLDFPIPWTDPIPGLDIHIVIIGVRGQQLPVRNQILRVAGTWGTASTVLLRDKSILRLSLLTFQRVFGKRVGGGQQAPSPALSPQGFWSAG